MNNIPALVLYRYPPPPLNRYAPPRAAAAISREQHAVVHAEHLYDNIIPVPVPVYDQNYTVLYRYIRYVTCAQCAHSAQCVVAAAINNEVHRR